MTNLLGKAIALAAQAHQEQLELSGVPYILHPLRMMFAVETEEERMAAILHDVVEDTPWTLEQLRAEGFPPAVIEAVDCLSRRESETYAEFIERAARNPIARRVKLADLEDNMDIRRLPTVDEKDCKRLLKYHRAWRRLKTGVQPDAD